jgi:3'-5' exoribonuclease
MVKHLLISHHGQYEFGSPKLPMTREALAFSFLDDLDSKMGATRAALAQDSGDEMWSTYVPALSRRFLRMDAFQGTKQSTTEKPAQLSLGATAGGHDEKK